jgi:hypothetical protein
MFILCSFIFLFTLYCYFKFIFDKINVQDNNQCSFHNNIEILRYLGYYNLNINFAMKIFITECVTFLLYSSIPNYKPKFCDLLDDYKISKELDNNNILYNNFEIFCKTQNKNKFDFTINEIITFIKTQDIYKKVETKLYYDLSRSIVLSKYIDDTTTKNLLNALTDNEKNILSNA